MERKLHLTFNGIQSTLLKIGSLVFFALLMLASVQVALANNPHPIQSTTDGGKITGGPFEFCVGDGEADNVSGIQLAGSVGTNSQWVVTDDQGNILGLPPMPSVVNFDVAGPGVCLIYHLSFEDGLEGLVPANNVNSDLVGDFDLSNSIRVYRNQPEGGELTGGPYSFTVSDGIADNVEGVSLSGNSGANSQWVVTDDQGNILGLPPSPEVVNFDGAGPGVCFIYHLSYADGLEGLAAENNINSDLNGCFDFSNSIRVERTEMNGSLNGGTVTADRLTACLIEGPARFQFEVEGVQGPNSSWILVDTGRIRVLGDGSNFNLTFQQRDRGMCQIYHVAYEDIEGLEVGADFDALSGTFDLSEKVEITRSNPVGGELTGGPYEFEVGDGIADNVSTVELSGNIGANSQWVVTDDQGNILGLPPSPEVVNFDVAGPGVCLIYHLSFADGLEGLAPANNINTDLEGCFNFSNPISVVRTDVSMVNGGEITGGPFEFCVGDGEADNVSGIELNGNSGANSQWVVTDDQGNILGLPPMPSVVNFDVAGPGVCLIYHLSFADGLEGLMPQNNVNTDLVGDFDLSNSIRVYRNQPEGGELTGGPYEFMVGDGIPDNVSTVELSGNSGANSQWVVTDDQGNILGLPPSPEVVNFDVAGPGVCLIYHLSFADGLEGLAAANNINTDLEGCFNFSNPISVVRTDVSMVNGGEITGGPFEFCVGDGEADNVSGIELNGNSGANSQWVVTDDQGNILGLPPMPSVVNFDVAGPGVCLIYHLSFADGLEGLMPQNNVNTDLVGDFDLSNSIRVYRNQPEGGELTGGPYEFMVGDGIPDNVSTVELSGNSGANSQWVVTDDQGNILGLPPSPEVVNFDVAGPGVCLIYHLSFADGLEGLAPANNINTDLMGCFDFSNAISVVRINAPITSDGGKITGGPFEFCVGDGEADNVSGIRLAGSEGDNSQWVVTDDQGNILGLPPSPEVVNFDVAGPGVCLIYHLSYADGLEGLAPENNINTDLAGDFDFSNAIRVYRNEPVGGELTGGPYEFVVGDGIADNVSTVELSGNSGANSQWVVTDDQGNILGLPPSPEVVNFDGAGPGTCFIYHLSYADGLEGLAAENNINTDLIGCFDFSNSIRVERMEQPKRESSAVVFPMPARNVVNVSMKIEKDRRYNVTLFDFGGNNVTPKSFQEDDKMSLDVQALPPGIYLLRVTDDQGKSFTKKVIIQ